MIRKLLLYTGLVSLLLYGARRLHYKGLLRQNHGYYAKYKTGFLKRNKFTVLFLGSSRAEMHYNTGLFDSLTLQNSFNLSLAGATPQVAFAALKAYLVRSVPPHYLIYEVDYHALNERSTQIREFNNYFPFLNNKVLLEEFDRIDGRMVNFYYNPYFSFPYTGFKNLSTSLHGWLGIPNKTDSLYYKGFFREVLRPHLIYQPVKKYFSFIHPVNQQYLDSITQLCADKKISLTLVSSPVFGGGEIDLINKKQITAQLTHMAHLRHLHYFDLSSLSFCNNRRLFIDHYHMNYEGAVKFTHIFSQVFNNKIKNNSLK